MTDSAGTPNSFDGTSLPPQPLLPPPPAPATMAPPPMAPGIPPLVEIAPEAPAPKRQRGKVLAAIAGLALVGGAVAVFATRDSGDGGSSAKFSLQAAAQQAATATNVAFEMNMTLGDTGALNATGRLDTDRGLMAMNMTMPQMGGAALDAIFDLNNVKMYLSADAFAEQGLDVPTDWIAFDVSALPGMEETFEQSTSNNPLDVAQVFDKAQNVEDLGVEDFRGEQVKHYRVTVSTAEAVAASPSLAKQIEQLGDDFPDEIVYDVYVTDGSQLRRVVYEMPVEGQTMSADIVYTAVGTIDPIVIPADDEVTDLMELMGG